MVAARASRGAPLGGVPGTLMGYERNAVRWVADAGEQRVILHIESCRCRPSGVTEVKKVSISGLFSASIMFGAAHRHDQCGVRPAGRRGTRHGGAT